MKAASIQEIANALLQEGVDCRESPWRHLILANVADADRPELRLLVLRGWEPAARCITLHTDSRSAKMASLRDGSQVALLGWDPARRIQLRLAGRLAVLQGDAAAGAFAALPAHGQRIYATRLAPGTPIADPDALGPALASEAAGAVFTVLRITLAALDYLHLPAGGQHRARLTWADGQAQATWVAP